MGAILPTLDRDIVFNVVAGGDMKANGTWGRKAGVHSWRTGEDLGGAWARIDRDVFGLYGRNEVQSYSGPGGWNDPDYLSLGYLAGGGEDARLRPTSSTRYMSLWCLVTAPLIFSGDMARLDDFTLSLSEQRRGAGGEPGPAGQGGPRVAKHGDLEVWAKDMEDGRKAVGLFNLGADQGQDPVTVKWSDLGITGKQLVRDLWRQRDLGTFEGQFSAPVGADGVVLVSLKPQPAP